MGQNRERASCSKDRQKMKFKDTLSMTAFL